jgi:hypothetical protein
MPITITLQPANVDGSGSNLLYAIAALTFSGNYPTGGDTLDFTTVADKLSSTQIIQAFADSQNGNPGYYVPVQGAALNNWKLKAFTGGGTEVAAGAYPRASPPTSCSSPSLPASCCECYRATYRTSSWKSCLGSGLPLPPSRPFFNTY